MQKKSKITIYAVAERAGVSISTVSRVMNNSDLVTEPTRVRVLKAIEALRFRPDRTAKSLARKAAKSFAVAIPTFTMPFHNELLKGIRFCLQRLDIDLLLCDLGTKSPNATLMNFLDRGSVQGLLLVGVALDDHIVEELETLHSAVVLVGTQHPAFDSFSWDDQAGAMAAIEHLVGLGHTRIAMIVSHTSGSMQHERLEGVREAMRKAGRSFSQEDIFSGSTEKHAGFSEESGYEAMLRILAERPDVTAVFALSDVQAIGAWKAIRDAGREIPGDIALVGYDDIKSSHYIGLSSVNQRMHEVGEQATELVLQRMTGNEKASPVHRVIVPMLVARRSSQPA